MTAQLSRERLEALANLQSLECMALPASHVESAEMARMLLAGMGTAVAGFDAATAIRACMEEFPEHVHDIVEECAQIAENTISNRHSAPPAPVAVPDEKSVNPLIVYDGFAEGWNACRAAMLKAGPVTETAWIDEAKKLAEMHGTSFVVFRNGEEPQCADPSKVVISFTDKGLGYPAAPEQEV